MEEICYWNRSHTYCFQYMTHTEWPKSYCAPVGSSILARVQITLNYSIYGYNKCWKWPRKVGQDSVVGIATRYGLDGAEIESRWGRDFPHPSGPALGPTKPPMGTGSFLGLNRSGRGVNQASPSSAEIKERVELHLYSPCAFMTCFMVKFTFTGDPTGMWQEVR